MTAPNSAAGASRGGRRSKPVVAIVGRPNVGKSTLFNRLVGGRPALVEDRPGVTRDRHYGESDWAGHEFILVDTGGFEPEAERGSMGALVRAQTELAIEEAAVIVFLVDGRTGLTAEDRDVHARLRRSGRPLLVAANKVDGASTEAAAMAVYELGADEVFLISSEHGRNISELLDAVVARLPPREQPVTGGEPLGAGEADAPAGTDAEEVSADRPIRVAVVGRPNAGKSSLVNRLLGTDRVLVYDEPGTTRDPIDTEFELDGQRFILIDTAGIRRRGKMSSAIEAYSVVKALAQLDHCDVALSVIDAAIGPSEQDARIVGLVHEKGRAQLMVITKWDLVRAPEGASAPASVREAREKLDEDLARKLGFASYVPRLTVSSRTGEGIDRLPGRIAQVYAEARRRVPTGELNRLFEQIQAHHPPPSDKGRPVKLYFIQQARVAPPTFVVSANVPERVHITYQRYLVNQLRETFGFAGVPIRLAFRKH